MITTETAFNEAFNLEKTLSIIRKNGLYSQYLLNENEKEEFYKLSEEVDTNTVAFELLEIVFKLEKHTQYLSNMVHKLQTNP